MGCDFGDDPLSQHGFERKRFEDSLLFPKKTVNPELLVIVREETGVLLGILFANQLVPFSHIRLHILRNC